MILYALIIGSIGCAFNLAFVLRLNIALGINDLVFIVFTSIVTDTLGLAFSMLPMLVLFAKITPKNIEATVFAMLTGVFNLSNSVLSPMMGVLINKVFVNVTTENLD